MPLWPCPGIIRHDGAIGHTAANVNIMESSMSTQYNPHKKIRKLELQLDSLKHELADSREKYEQVRTQLLDIERLAVFADHANSTDSLAADVLDVLFP